MATDESEPTGTGEPTEAQRAAQAPPTESVEGSTDPTATGPESVAEPPPFDAAAEDGAPFDGDGVFAEEGTFESDGAFEGGAAFAGESLGESATGDDDVGVEDDSDPFETASDDRSDDASGDDEEPASDATGTEDDGPEIVVEAVESAPRKRRRRRRKRRGDGTADTGGAEAAAHEPPHAEGPSSGDSARERRERPAFSPGDQVFGKVAQLTEQSILVDIAGKATGLFDLASWTGEPPKEGDQFIAKVQSCSMRGGMVMLVTEPTAPADARALLRQAAESSTPIEGWVTAVIKGGVEIDFGGIRAFGPASHVDLRPGADLSYLLGQRLDFLVTQYAKKGRDIVVSRKAMLEQAAEAQRGELLSQIQPDTVCEGVVRRVLNWGVFVTLPEHGDVEGVIHMSEASHDRGAKLPELFKSGQHLSVKVLRIDDKGKLWLSRRAVEKNPWDDVAQKYPVGSRHQGLVVRLAEFGAFVQLEPGVDGLCHVSDLSFQPVEHPSEAVEVGQPLEVVVANLDAHAHKIGLHPAAPADEQGESRPRLQAHQTVNVVVMQVKDGGLAVRIVGLTGRAQRGFIPSGQTGTPRGTELRKVFPVGKRFEAKVVEVDPRKGESKLSIRALKDDAEREAYRQYRRQLQKEASFGTLGDLLKKS